jgi:hypothetical protein
MGLPFFQPRAPSRLTPPAVASDEVATDYRSGSSASVCAVPYNYDGVGAGTAEGSQTVSQAEVEGWHGQYAGVTEADTGGDAGEWAG